MNMDDLWKVSLGSGEAQIGFIGVGCVTVIGTTASVNRFNACRVISQQGRTYVGAMVGYSPGYFFLKFFYPCY